MSSPIAIPQSAVQRSSSPSSSSSSSSSPNSQLYVPVHKRRGGADSASSSRAPSPAPAWRSPSPSKASSRGGNNKSAYKAFHPRASSPRPHIPAPTTIPQPTALPFMYSFTQLLALSASPATLTPPQLDSIEDLIELCAAPASSEKASRRRRTGRRTNKPAQQKAVAKTADVDVRRTRQGHGTWGWHAFDATKEASVAHEHEMDAPWRHAASLVAVAA